jgi:hypothetical protein
LRALLAEKKVSAEAKSSTSVDSAEEAAAASNGSVAGWNQVKEGLFI